MKTWVGRGDDRPLKFLSNSVSASGRADVWTPECQAQLLCPVPCVPPPTRSEPEAPARETRLCWGGQETSPWALHRLSLPGYPFSKKVLNRNSSLCIRYFKILRSNCNRNKKEEANLGVFWRDVSPNHIHVRSRRRGRPCPGRPLFWAVTQPAFRVGSEEKPHILRWLSHI